MKLFQAHARCSRSPEAAEVLGGPDEKHLVSKPLPLNLAEHKRAEWMAAVESASWEFTVEPFAFIGDTVTGATFSPCRKYRYTLWRRWVPNCPPAEMVAFIGLNPSTADEFKNDPTIRRCINFAKQWNFGGMVMLNLFGFRATDPAVMKSSRDPVGPWNDMAISHVYREVDQAVCAWGVHGAHRTRGKIVRAMLREMHSEKYLHLGLTKDGHPKHPLYLPAATERQAF